MPIFIGKMQVIQDWRTRNQETPQMFVPICGHTRFSDELSCFQSLERIRDDAWIERSRSQMRDPGRVSKLVLNHERHLAIVL